MAAEGASAGVGDGAADHDGQFLARGSKGILNGKEAGLGVEGVKDGFDKEHVDSALNEGFGLFLVGGGQFVEAYGAVARAVHVGAQAQGAVGWSDGSGDKARFVGRRVGVGGLAGKPSSGEVEFTHQGFHSIVRHRNGLGVEGVGFDHVGARGKVLGVNFFYDLRLAQVEQVVVAFERMGPICKARTSVAGLVEAVVLEHRAHCTVQY